MHRCLYCWCFMYTNGWLSWNTFIIISYQPWVHSNSKYVKRFALCLNNCTSSVTSDHNFTSSVKTLLFQFQALLKGQMLIQHQYKRFSLEMFSVQIWVRLSQPPPPQTFFGKGFLWKCSALRTCSNLCYNQVGE